MAAQATVYYNAEFVLKTHMLNCVHMIAGWDLMALSGCTLRLHIMP